MKYWEKACPTCQAVTLEPVFTKASSKSEFKCSNCDAELTRDAGVPILLALVCALPFVFLSYAYLQRPFAELCFGLIAMAFGALFWPLRRIVGGNVTNHATSVQARTK